jgi:hypothetical protein
VNTLVAYTVIKQPGKFLLLPVGNVPAGTQCDATQNVNGYYMVPASAVNWSGNVRTDTPVASCS